jgi:enoyl-CoA hydratase/carnithine racemase
MPNGKVRYARDGGVALLTLTNPPANGYSYEMMRDLDEAVLKARFDDAVQVIVLAGEGPKFFCAGADIAMLDAVTPSFKYAFCLHANETLLRLEHTPKLVIAALGGHCVGGGLEVALACDLRVARKGSGRCGLPEVTLGVLPGTGGTQRLARTLGKAKAIELMNLLLPQRNRFRGVVLDALLFDARGRVVELWTELCTATGGRCRQVEL